MIGIDTKILLGLWLNDDPAQNKRIDSLLAEHGSTPGSLYRDRDLTTIDKAWNIAA